MDPMTVSLAAGPPPTEPSQPEHMQLKMIWDDCMENQTKPVPHDKTEVLLLSWDEEVDALKTKHEVDDLRNVFETKYKFGVQAEKLKLDGKKRTQHQINALLANFVKDHDEERTLLIIYYAGHGQAVNGEFKMFADTSAEAQKHATTFNRGTIVWQAAESIIINTDADVLLILDCCEAGDLCRPYRSPHGRSFELFAACSAGQKTRAPSDESFTRALIKALEKLGRLNRHFDTSELLRAIKKVEGFPEEQYPQLYPRIDPCPTHITIAPYTDRGAAPPIQEDPEHAINAYLDLRLAFHRLDHEVLKRTAEAIRRAMGKEEHELGALRVSFKGVVYVPDMIKPFANHWLKEHQRAKAQQNAAAPSKPSMQQSKGQDYNQNQGLLSPAPAPAHESSSQPPTDDNSTSMSQALDAASSHRLPTPSDMANERVSAEPDHGRLDPKGKIITGPATPNSQDFAQETVFDLTGSNALSAPKRRYSESDSSGTSPRRSPRLRRD